MTDKDIFVLRALLMADLQGDGTLGGDCMIQIFHARTPPEIWLHCMVCLEDWLSAVLVYS